MKQKQDGIRFICDRCGQLQKPDADKSNENWEVFNCEEKCECGGKFVMKFAFE